MLYQGQKILFEVFHLLKEEQQNHIIEFRVHSFPLKEERKKINNEEK